MPDLPDRSASNSAANRADAIALVLRENLAELNDLLANVAADDLDIRSAPGEWSVRQILLHVIHAERWMQPQLLELRQTVDPDAEMPSVGGVTLPDTEANADLNELRWALNAVREDTLRLLQGLGPAQMREPANVEVAGEVIDLSFRTMLLTAADHQLFHARQIARTLARD